MNIKSSVLLLLLITQFLQLHSNRNKTIAIALSSFVVGAVTGYCLYNMPSIKKDNDTKSLSLNEEKKITAAKTIPALGNSPADSNEKIVKSVKSCNPHSTSADERVPASGTLFVYNGYVYVNGELVDTLDNYQPDSSTPYLQSIRSVDSVHYINGKLVTKSANV